MQAKLLAIVAALSILAISGCSKIDEGPIDNLRGGQIQIIGHAGLGFESMLSPYPSNTLTSIRKLIEGYGADGTEIDIQLSQDSVPMLYHDNDLESLTDCIGKTIEYPSEQLLNCNYRTDFHSHILQNEKIISFESIVQRYAGTAYDPWLYLDLKNPQDLDEAGAIAFTGRFIRAINRVITAHDIAHRIVAEAGNVGLLLAMRQHNPDVLLMYDNNDFDHALQTAITHQLHGIVIQNDNVTKEQIKLAHQNGIQVAIFGVILRQDIIDAVNKHPDIIQTDNIVLLQEILSK